MSTTLTPSAARGTVTVPTGTDRVNIADLTTTAMQAILNRAEWASKELIDFQHLNTDAYNTSTTNSTTLANINTNLGLTFTDLKAGDSVLLIASVPWFSNLSNVMIARFRWHDGTDPVGNSIMQHTPGVANYEATATFFGYESLAADAASKTYRPQWAVEVATTTQAELLSTHGVQLIGVHVRLGAA